MVRTRALKAFEGSEEDGSWGGYNLLTNNCETFAYWCSTGRREAVSRQALRGIVGVGGAITVAAAAGGVATGYATGLAVSKNAKRVVTTLELIGTTSALAMWATKATDTVSNMVTKKKRCRAVVS
ncbi:unnamed protein product [Choristocarpus tenellus]